MESTILPIYGMLSGLDNSNAACTETLDGEKTRQRGILTVPFKRSIPKTSLLFILYSFLLPQLSEECGFGMFCHTTANMWKYPISASSSKIGRDLANALLISMFSWRWPQRTCHSMYSTILLEAARAAKTAGNATNDPGAE
mmetsp:Transcript_4346/g.17077  ORF Transcript_4346/g.17077 Transcript_4346/m.17077 type:complete len:141 (+) Transcript_4346:101-523(+)|eukprot:scaffold2538_cov235-Pinguiococcus_pyrenoidosus.AAC.9